MTEKSAYELIPKKTITNLREENLSLKNQLNELKKSQSENKTLEKFKFEIIDELRIETNKEREIITKELENINELNKITIDSMSKNTKILEEQLNSLIVGLKSLIDNITTKQETSKKEEKENIIEILKLFLKEIKEEKTQNTQELEKIENINIKLENLDFFLKNLKILLGSIKPKNISID
jgi:hypothetical protein